MEKITLKNNEFKKTDYNVTVNNDVIGYIRYRPNEWPHEKPYSAFFGQSFLNRYKTPYEAKLAIIQEFHKEDFGEKSKTANIEALPSDPNAEFYPTPSKLAGMMLAGIDWSNVSTVLEPSAGKGDLCEAAQKAYKNSKGYYDSSMSVDCIELDPNLQSLLLGKGFNVVFNDFMSFTTQKKYDIILMNPPFSVGEYHLMKAIRLQERYGGQIVCLLNAETLKNTYTNMRKLLADKLKKLNASVQFVSNAFKHAERKTGVEVAIVRVSIPEPKKRSFIIDELQKAEEYKRKSQSGADEMLTSNNPIERMIGEYNFEVQALARLIEEYEAILPFIWNTRDTDYRYKTPILELKVLGKHDLDVNRCMQAVRMKYWDSFFHQPELTEKFTSNILNEYNSRVDEMKNSDFNMFNIQKVLTKMNAELIDGVKESIVKLFEKMTAEHTYYTECQNNIHYYTGWKTNKAHRVGKKVILPVNGFSAYSSKKDELDTYYCYEVLSDIEKVFNYLDGCVTDEISLRGALDRANASGNTRNIQCKYFDVTFYKKGTMHIVFTVPRVVDALNIYMGKDKDWLPPYYGKVSYEDLSENDRRTVDEFQGKEEYQKVFQNQSAYLIEITGNPADILLLADKNV